MKDRAFSAVFCILLLSSYSPTLAPGCGGTQGMITNVPSLGGATVKLYGLNANAQVAGYSQLANVSTWHAFISSGGATRDLGTLGGGGSYAYCINGLGMVAGEAFAANGAKHAFLFDGSSMHDIGTLGGSSSMAVAINDAGQVAGMSTTADEWLTQAFLFQNDTLIPLGHLGGDVSFAAAINQGGAVVGDSYTWDWDTHAFLWQNGQMVDLGTLGGFGSSAVALNNKNQVVGVSGTDTYTDHAFLYGDRMMNDLGTLGGANSKALAINDAGQVVGYSEVPGGSTHGFLYTEGAMNDLGTLGGSRSTAVGINSQGQVIGTASTSTGVEHAFVWQNGVMVDLNDLLDAGSQWVLNTADFINDNGVVSGKGSYEGQPQWYIMSLGSRNTAPVAIAGANQTGECQAPVTLDGSASYDADGDHLSFEWSLGSQVLGTDARITTVFPNGEYLITLKVTDPCGDSAQATVVVNMTDSQPPLIAGPTTLQAPADAQCHAAIPDLRSQMTLWDNCTPAEALAFEQNPIPGTVVGAGVYSISFKVTDASGNSSSGLTQLNVVDTTAPTLTALPSLTLRAGSDGSALVPDLLVSVVDGCSSRESISISQNPAVGSSLLPGSYLAQLVAVDAAGNRAVAQVPLTIEDRTAPVVSSASVSPSVLSPPNHQLVPVRVSIVASDNCDPAPVSKIVRITSNELLSPEEAQISGDLTACLAATRSPSGGGRVYYLHIETTDVRGNLTRSVLQVSVPKGNGSSGTTTDLVKVNRVKSH